MYVRRKKQNTYLLVLIHIPKLPKLLGKVVHNWNTYLFTANKTAAAEQTRQWPSCPVLYFVSFSSTVQTCLWAVLYCVIDLTISIPFPRFGGKMGWDNPQ